MPSEPMMPKRLAEQRAIAERCESTCKGERMELVDEIERLMAIVARTADGVEIVAGMEVWTPHTLGPSRDVVKSVCASVKLVEPSHWAEGDADADRLYSTRAAAEAASTQAKDDDNA